MPRVIICIPCAFIVLLLITSHSHAIPYVSADARGLAMGRAGVASADNPVSAHYNPALPAAYSERKHKGGNQRIIFPYASGFASENIQDLLDIDDKDYDDDIEQRINNFNNGLMPDDTLSVLTTLDNDLDNISSNPVYANAQVGFAVTIPDMREGGGISVSRRFVMDGRVNYSNQDRQLVDDYIDELAFITEGGSPGTQHPELYQGGSLIDPTDSLSSDIDGAGLMMYEIALTMAWQVELFDTSMMLGFTPKWMEVTTYEYSAEAISGRLTEKSELDVGGNFNLDLGWAKHYANNVTLGVGVKNLIPQQYETESGKELDIDPQLRIGGEWKSDWGTFTADLDLTENKPLSTGDPSREIAVGYEWPWGKQRFRAGINRNLSATGDDDGFAFSVGARFRFLGIFTDIAAGKSGGQTIVGLQFGIQY